MDEVERVAQALKAEYGQAGFVRQIEEMGGSADLFLGGIAQTAIAALCDEPDPRDAVVEAAQELYDDAANRINGNPGHYTIGKLRDALAALDRAQDPKG